MFLRFCGGKFGVRFGVRFGVKLVTEGGVCCGTVDVKSGLRQALACSVQPRESPTQRFILSRAASAPTSGRASRFFLSARDIRQLASWCVVTVRGDCRGRRIVAVPRGARSRARKGSGGDRGEGAASKLPAGPERGWGSLEVRSQRRGGRACQFCVKMWLVAWRWRWASKPSLR